MDMEDILIYMVFDRLQEDMILTQDDVATD